MNVSAISSTGKQVSVQSSTGASSSKVSKILKEIQDVQTKITEEQNSKDDAKTKSQLVAAYQAELQALEAQLQQAEQEAAAKKAGNQSTSQASGNTTDASGNASSGTSGTVRYSDAGRYLNKVV